MERCGAEVLSKEDINQNPIINYSKFNLDETKQTADAFFEKALETQDESEKSEFLKNAVASYYILSNIDKSNSYPCIQLARIYDLQNNDLYAKAYFSRVLGLNSKDADGNFYFAEYYYRRNQYEKALEFYQKALLYGKEADSQTLKNIASIYERFGDIPRANFYYRTSLEKNPEDKTLKDKIDENIVNEYKDAGYFKRRLRN